MTIYCFIEGVSLFTSYLFLPFFNKGDYFEKPGITDDYRCEMPLYKDFLKQSIALNQGANKIIFTACPSGKLKLAFTSPDVISTSPKNVLFFCYSNSS